MSDLAIKLYEDFEKEYPYMVVDMDMCIDYVLQTGSTDAHNFYAYLMKKEYEKE